MALVIVRITGVVMRSVTRHVIHWIIVQSHQQRAEKICKVGVVTGPETPSIRPIARRPRLNLLIVPILRVRRLIEPPVRTVI